MSLQQELLGKMKRELDARTAAIIEKADLCFEADALAEALKEAGLSQAAAAGYSAFDRGDNTAKAEVWVTCLFSKAVDVLRAIFQADLGVADVVIGPALPTHSDDDPAHTVEISFHGLEVKLSGYFGENDALAILRAFKPEQPAIDLIGRSRLAEEVPA